MSKEVGGVTLTPQSTGREIFAAHLKASGAPASELDAHAGFGPPLHVHADPLGGVMHAEAPAAPVAPAKAPPTAGEQAAKVAEFDAQMRAEGKQLPAARSTLAVGEFDQAGFEALTEHYKVLALGAKNTPEVAARFKATYEKDVAALYDGRQLSAAELAKIKTSQGKVDSFLPKATAPAAPPASQHTPEAWAEGHKSVTNEHGMIPVERLNPAALSGYTLPRLIEGQHYDANVFADLASARAAGFTQAQVTAYIKAQMTKDGWLR